MNIFSMKRKFHAWWRVGAYATALASIGVIGLGKYGVAKAGETSLNFGRELFELRDLLNQGQKVELNGETMYFTAQGTDQSMDVVMARMTDYCDGHPSSVDPLFGKAPKGLGAAGMGVVKRFGDNDGVVSCLARSEASPVGVGPALEAFAKTGNLGELGMMRFVYVRKPESGVGSQVMAAWTNQQFDLNAFMIPEKGDSRGSDPLFAPRPPDAVRRFSARLQNGAYGATVFRTSHTPDEINAFYEKELVKGGFHATTATPGHGRLFLKAPDLSVQVTITEDKNERVVNLVESTIAMPAAPVDLR